MTTTNEKIAEVVRRLENIDLEPGDEDWVDDLIQLVESIKEDGNEPLPVEPDTALKHLSTIRKILAAWVTEGKYVGLEHYQEMVALIDRTSKKHRKEDGNEDTALAEMRAVGWMVAVHNDYRQDGEFRTFWLFTHPDGRWVKGEGKTDRDAIDHAMKGAGDVEPQNSLSPSTKMIVIRSRFRWGVAPVEQ